MFDACVSAASTLANSPHPGGMSLQHISIISPVVLAGQASHILEAAIDVPSGSMQLASVGSKHAPKPAPAQLHCSCTVAKVEQASAVAGQSTAPPASGMSAGRYCVASGLRCATHYPRQLVQLPAVGCIAVPGSAQLSGHSMHPGRSDAVLHLSAAWIIAAAPLQIPVGLSALAVQGAESGKGCGWIHPTAALASNGGTAAGPVFDFCLKEEQQALFHASCLEVREMRGKALASPSTAAQLASLDSLVYEVQWQAAWPHNTVSAYEQRRAHQQASSPLFSLTQHDAAWQDVRTAERVSLRSAYHSGQATWQCAAQTVLLQAVAAQAGLGSAVHLATHASQPVAHTPAGCDAVRCGGESSGYGVQSMLRVAAMELGMVQWSASDADLFCPRSRLATSSRRVYVPQHSAGAAVHHSEASP